MALLQASAASLKVTDLLFVKQQHNYGELQSVFVILFFVLFIGQLSMQLVADNIYPDFLKII